MLFALAFIFLWESMGREKFLYSEVVVLNQSVEADTQITADMLDQIKINSDNFIEGAVVNKDDVIGKYSCHYIPKYSQLSLAYFKDSIVNIENFKDKYIFTIPSDWLLTLPNSLRRGDIVYFYPVKTLVENNGETSSFNNPGSKKYLKESDLLEAEVAFVKDSGNREVVNTSGKERLDGSANIVSIEIVADYKDVCYLQDLVDNGFKFIILYKNNID